MFGTTTNITLQVKLLSKNATIPTRAYINDAGLDLYATEHVLSDNLVTYHTGVSVKIPENYVGLLFSRSSIYKTDLLQRNCVGVIDSGYRGELVIKYLLTKPSEKAMLYTRGDRIAQLVLVPIPNTEVQVVEQFIEQTTNLRGIGGYGSTGR